MNPDVLGGFIRIAAAAMLGYLWVSGRGARGVAALRAALEGQPYAPLANYNFDPTRGLARGSHGRR